MAKLKAKVKAKRKCENWNAGKPHRRWRRANALQIEIAKEPLLYEMNTMQVSIGLAPAPVAMHTGHMIRVVNSTNPEWYSKLAKEKNVTAHRGPRRGGGLRINTVKALKRLIDGWYDPIGLEGDILRNAVRYLVEQGYMYPGLEDVLLEPGFLGEKSEYHDYLETATGGYTGEPGDDIPF